MISPQRYLGIQGKKVQVHEKKVSIEEIHSKKDVKKHRIDNNDKMEDSLVFGLLSEDKSVKLETGEAEGDRKNEIPRNSQWLAFIAYWKKFFLDPYKKLISQQLDEVLKSCLVSEPTKSAKKIVKKKLDAKATKKVSSEDSSDSSYQHVEKDEEQEDETYKAKYSKREAVELP